MGRRIGGPLPKLENCEKALQKAMDDDESKSGPVGSKTRFNIHGQPRLLGRTAEGACKGFFKQVQWYCAIHGLGLISGLRTVPPCWPPLRIANWMSTYCNQLTVK